MTADFVQAFLIVFNEFIDIAAGGIIASGIFVAMVWFLLPPIARRA